MQGDEQQTDSYDLRYDGVLHIQAFHCAGCGASYWHEVFGATRCAPCGRVVWHIDMSRDELNDGEYAQ